MNEEYTKSVADLMVIKGRPLHTVPGNYIVSDTTHVWFDEVDFGWGLPTFGGPAMALSLISMYVLYEEKWEKGAVMLICLPTLVMEMLERELKKLTDEEISPIRCIIISRTLRLCLLSKLRFLI